MCSGKNRSFDDVFVKNSLVQIGWSNFCTKTISFRSFKLLCNLAIYIAVSKGFPGRFYCLNVLRLLNAYG